MLAAEALYVGAHFAHVVAYEERQRERRIHAQMVAIERRRGRERRAPIVSGYLT